MNTPRLGDFEMSGNPRALGVEDLELPVIQPGPGRGLQTDGFLHQASRGVRESDLENQWAGTLGPLGDVEALLEPGGGVLVPLDDPRPNDLGPGRFEMDASGPHFGEATFPADPRQAQRNQRRCLHAPLHHPDPGGLEIAPQPVGAVRGLRALCTRTHRVLGKRNGPLDPAQPVGIPQPVLFDGVGGYWLVLEYSFAGARNVGFGAFQQGEP